MKKEFYAIPNYELSNNPSCTPIQKVNFVSKEEYDKSIEKFSFFIKCNSTNLLSIYKNETEKFEKVTKIVINLNTEDEKTIAGPELKKINSLESFIETIKGKSNIKIWSEKSGPYFIASSKQIITDSYTLIPKKITIEETEKTLKINAYSTETRISFYSGNFEKQECISTLSFSPNEKRYRNYQRKDINASRPRCSFNNEYGEYTFLDKLPENMLKIINDEVISYYNKILNKEYTNNDITPQGILSFAVCPDNIYHFHYNSLFDYELPKDKENFEEEISKHLNLKNDDFFKEKLYENIDALIAISAIKKGGIKEYEKFYDFFNRNLNKHLSMHTRDENYKTIKDAFNVMKKYRSEDEILDALNSTNEFYFKILRTIVQADREHLFDGQLFDRFAYNRFNEYADSLLIVYEREKLKEIKNDLDKASTCTKSLDGFNVRAVNDKETIDNFIKNFLWPSDDYAAKRIINGDRILKEILAVEDKNGSFCFIIIDNRRHSTPLFLNYPFNDENYKLFINNYYVASKLSDFIIKENERLYEPTITKIKDDDELPFY